MAGITVPKKGTLTNQEFAEQDGFFRRCCWVIGVQPTKRQASKFRRRQGRAWIEGRARLRSQE